MLLENIETHKKVEAIYCPQKHYIGEVVVATFENGILKISYSRKDIRKLREELSELVNADEGFALSLGDKVWYEGVDKIKMLHPLKPYLSHRQSNYIPITKKIINKTKEAITHCYDFMKGYSLSKHSH